MAVVSPGGWWKATLSAPGQGLWALLPWPSELWVPVPSASETTVGE